MFLLIYSTVLVDCLNQGFEWILPYKTIGDVDGQ